MATVKLEIDTDTGVREPAHKLSSTTDTLAAQPIFLIALIKLDPKLRKAFKDGANQTPSWFDGRDYDDDIRGQIRSLDGLGGLIVTAGGFLAFSAAKDAATKSKFVSLAGVEPTGNIGNCYGGVCLNTVKANSSRVDFLEANGRTRADIGLFCNHKSGIVTPETTDWQTIPGVNHTIVYGGNTANKNDPNHYFADLQAADALGITTLIISSDPFFQDSKEKLIKAANDWVALPPVGTRYVCYPFDDYGNSNGSHKPTAGTASWYGPDLVDAYNQLGQSATLAMAATRPMPFAYTTDTSGDF